MELRRARGFVIRDLLRVLNCTTILQVGDDAGGPEGRAASCQGGPQLAAGLVTLESQLVGIEGRLDGFHSNRLRRGVNWREGGQESISL